MSIKLRFLVLAVVAVVVLLIISLLIAPPKKPREGVIPMPTRVVVPTRMTIKYFSDTGAKYISPTEKTYTEDWLIGDLRTKMPTETAAFSMKYDYKTDKFIVIIKDKSTTNHKLFWDWMGASGYDLIPSKYFIIE
jgi:hypothetical protein